ncbi:MAG: NUDIX hydrolase [Candidatus Saccharimonadales bacterium]
MHHIQYSILESLINHKTQRFSEMRPPRVDSNLFQYHLGKLIKDGYVTKAPEGYSLSGEGLYYADRQSSLLKAERIQAKIVTLLIIRNKNGEILLRQKLRQPFLGSYLLPAGKIHAGEQVTEAAHREMAEKTGLAGIDLGMSGTVHNTIMSGDVIVSEYYGYLFRGSYDGQIGDGLHWYKPGDNIELTPGVEQVLATKFGGFAEAIVQI